MAGVRRGWWRRNAVALVALAIATAAMIVVGVVLPIRAWSDNHRPGPLVAAGEEARIGDARFRLTKAGLFHPDGDPGVDVPKGSVILAVLIRVSTTRKLSAGCGVSLVRNGTDPISWDPIVSPSTYRYQLSDSTEHACELDESAGSRTLEETFLVPATVYDRVTISVEVSSTRSAERGSARLALPEKPYSDTATR